MLLLFFVCMMRRPPIATRTDTLLPYATRDRSPADPRQPPREAARRPAASAPQARLRGGPVPADRSEEHTSELQSLLRISYAVFCLQQKHCSDKTLTANYANPFYTRAHKSKKHCHKRMRP